MVSGTVPVTTPISLSMHVIMTVSLRDSAIWLSMVSSTWLDFWKRLMARLGSMRVSVITVAVPTLLDINIGWTGRM